MIHASYANQLFYTKKEITYQILKENQLNGIGNYGVNLQHEFTAVNSNISGFFYGNILP